MKSVCEVNFSKLHETPWQSVCFAFLCVIAVDRNALIRSEIQQHDRISVSVLWNWFWQEPSNFPSHQTGDHKILISALQWCRIKFGTSDTVPCSSLGGIKFLSWNSDPTWNLFWKQLNLFCYWVLEGQKEELCRVKHQTKEQILALGQIIFLHFMHFSRVPCLISSLLHVPLFSRTLGPKECHMKSGQ